MSEYKFTKIEQDLNPRTVLPGGSVSISKTGRIGLSSEFTDEYGIGAESRALLYWDGSSNAIAITFGSREPKPTPGSFTKVQAMDGYGVTFIGGGTAGYIAASGFFKKIGIDPSGHQGYYKYETLDADTTGIVDAGKTVFIVTLQ